MEFFVSDQVGSFPHPLTPIAPGAPTTMPQTSSDFERQLSELVNQGKISAETKANLDRRIQNAMANGNLTDEVVSKALNVIGEINDKALVAEFLKSGRGGISLLAKLEGLPTDLREKIVKNVAAKNLHIANLNQILDEYHNGGLDREELEKIINCMRKLGANGVYRALKNGGINGLLKTAEGLAGGTGEGGSSAGGVGAGVVTSPFTTVSTGALISAFQNVDPKTNLVEFFSRLPRAEKDRHKLIAEAVLEFAEDLRKKNKEEERQQAEEDDGRRGLYTFGSNETLEDLHDALETVLNYYGGSFNNAVPSIRQYIQTCYKFNNLGDNITIGNLLEVFQTWLDLFNRSKSEKDDPATPTNQPHPQNQLSPQPPTAQPPASSLVASGLPNTSSHRA
jgi:hypothetical protein